MTSHILLFIRKSKMSFFGGANPFSTQTGQLIEQATDGGLASENWGLNMEICDVINETDDGPKDATKAIKKRLSTSAGKNYTTVMYTLTVLETCVKNCGKKFHIFVANKDFLQELVKVIQPKNDPPTVVQEKVLSLIQTWADAFRGSPDLKEVGKVYEDLKKKGIDFPMTDLDAMAPIHTPARTHELEPTATRTATRAPSVRTTSQQAPPVGLQQVPIPAGMSPQHMSPAHQPPPQQQQLQQQQQQQQPSGPTHLTQEQMGKLKRELEIVQQNHKVFSEMLMELVPGQESPADLELLLELHKTCKQMQHRLVQLIESVSNEEVTGELLRVNDEMNNVFLRYERFEKNRPAPVGGTVSQSSRVSPSHAPSLQLPPPSTAGAGGQTQSQGEPVTNLIDFDTPSPQTQPPSSNPFGGQANSNDIHLQLAGMTVGSSSVSSTLENLNPAAASNAPTGDGDEFDMFAQSRTAFEQSKPQPGSAASAYANQQSDQLSSGGLGSAVNIKNSGNPYAENVKKQPEAELMRQISDKESDYSEMEEWLKANPESALGNQESATSSEFDRFLAERAKEGEGLPEAGQGTASRNGTRGRQLQKDDQENALFAL